MGSRVGVNVIKPNRSLSGAIRNPPLHTHSHMHDGTRGVEKECSDEQEQNTVQRGFHIALHYDHHGLTTVTSNIDHFLVNFNNGNGHLLMNNYKISLKEKFQVFLSFTEAFFFT